MRTVSYTGIGDCFVLFCLIASIKIKKSDTDLYIMYRIKKIRTIHKLTQPDIAAILNVSRSLVGHFENPKKSNRYKSGQLVELAKYFKCSIEEFFPETYIGQKRIYP